MNRQYKYLVSIRNNDFMSVSHVYIYAESKSAARWKIYNKLSRNDYIIISVDRVNVTAPEIFNIKAIYEKSVAI